MKLCARYWRTKASILSLLVLSSSVIAQPRHEPPSEAVEFYNRARDHYRNRRYADAIIDLRRALVLDPGSPTLVYNLARVYEMAGEIDPAIEYYQSYLHLLPASQSEERGRIEEALRRLHAKKGTPQQERLPPAAMPPTTEHTTSVQRNLPMLSPRSTVPLEEDDEDEEEPRFVSKRGVADAAFWSVLGTGATLLVAGSIVGVVALERRAKADDFVLGIDGTAHEHQQLRDQAKHLALSADILLGTSGAALVTAGLLYVLRTRTEEVLPKGRVEATVSGNGSSALLLVRGRF